MTTRMLSDGQAAIWFAQQLETHQDAGSHNATGLNTGRFQCMELLDLSGLGDVTAHDLQHVIGTCLGQIPSLVGSYVADADGQPTLTVSEAAPQTITVDIDQPEQWRNYATSDRGLSRPQAEQWANGHLTTTADDRATDGVELSGSTITDHHLCPHHDGGWWWAARFHHIAADGFSIHILLRWVFACLQAHKSHTAMDDWPDCPLSSHAQGLDNERAYLDSDRYAQDKAFWEHAPLMDQAPRLMPGGAQLCRVAIEVAAGRRKKWRELARSTNTNELDLLVCALGYYTAWVSGTEHASIGMPHMNRPRGPVAPLPTVTVPPVVIGTRIGQSETVATLLERHREPLTDTRAHAAFRSEWIRRLRTNATSHTAALSGPNINLRPFNPDFPVLGTRVPWITLAVGPVEDTEIILQSGPDGTAQLIAFGFATDRDLGEQRLRSHLDRLIRLLDAWADGGADCNTDLVQILDDTERQQLMAISSGPSTQIPGPHTLRGRMHATRQRVTPTDTAISWISPDDGQVRHMTWEQTFHTIDALAQDLRDHGAQPGDLVAVQLPRGVEQFTTVAAAIEAGCAWLPIAHDLPQARREHMIATAQPTVMVDGDGIRQLTGSARNGHQRQDAQGTASTHATHAAPEPQDLAYVLFTSGSTGKPKGVAVNNIALVNRLDWMLGYYNITGADRLMQKTACSFDVSVWEFIAPLTHGIPVAIATEGVHKDPLALAQEIQRMDVSICHFVPSALKTFIAAVGDTSGNAAGTTAGNGAEPAGPRLRAIITSGEALDVATAHAALAHAGAVHNLYGPTEAAIDVTAYSVTGSETTIPIGTPVPNTQCFVLDPALRPLPVGTPGMLYLGGVQLALGYIGAPELTNAAFIHTTTVDDAPGATDYLGSVANGGGAAAGRRIYTTGDIAAWMPDGNLDYLGRKDSQVKIRGQRLELAEIESVLTRHPSVSSCAVVVKTIANQPALVGYVVASTGATGATGAGQHGTSAGKHGTGAGEELSEALGEKLTAQLSEHLAQHLPEYMIPTAWCRLEQLPTTANGKLDHAALPTPQARDTQPIDTPRTPTEQAVLDAFVHALGTSQEHFGVEHNFFSAGGNSLSAVTVLTQLRRTYPQLTLADIFTGATPRGVANLITRRSGASALAETWVIREHHSGVPVVCLYPAGGLGWSYAGLAAHLDSRRGIIAIQAPGVDGSGQTPAASITHAAARAAELISEVSGVSKVSQVSKVSEVSKVKEVLTGSVQDIDAIGWSLGGVIAHELAHHLREHGYRLRNLVLLDAYPPAVWQQLPVPTQQERLEGLLTMAGIQREAPSAGAGAGAGAGADTTAAAETSTNTALGTDTGADAAEGADAAGELTEDQVLQMLRHSPGLFSQLEEHTCATIMQLMQHHATIMRQHQPRPAAVNAHHIQALRNDLPDKLAAAARPTVAPPTRETLPDSWDSLVDTLQVHRLDVTHPQMVAPSTLQLVAHILDQPEKF